MRALVIGGTGFISRHTVGELLRRGHEVTILHRGRSSNPFGPAVQEALGDRLDRRSVEAALRGRRFDAVLDLAYAWDSRTGPREVSFVVDALEPPPGRYVYLSSASVYGEGPMPLTESGPRAPQLGGYSEDKIAVEDYLFERHREGRFGVAVLRAPWVYGPWNTQPREAWFWDRIVAGRPVIIPDDGRTLFHWVAARDVAWAMAEAAERPEASGEAFNVAEAAPVAHADFVDRLARAAGRPVEKVLVPRARIRELGGNPMGKPMYFAAGLDTEVSFSLSIDKARRVLGFRPTDPGVGLREAFEWYVREDRGTRSPTFAFDKIVLGR